ncbi:MAG: DUF1552 domain-containing protein [Myxococcota bacterium]
MTRHGRRSWMRRACLGAGAGLAAPWFLTPRGARTQEEFPKRLVLFLTPNGTAMDEFWSDGKGGLGPILEPLLPLREKVLRIRGLDNQGGVDAREIIPNHEPDWNSMLTGREPVLRPGARRATGVSVDQHIAAADDGGTTYRSLHFGVKPHFRGSESQTPLWRRVGNKYERVLSENSPYRAFERLFSGFMAPAAVVDAARLRRRSVLDAMLDQASAVECAAGAELRAPIQSHLESVRNLETRLALTPVEQCAPEAPPGGLDLGTDADVPEVGRAQMDLLTLALSCDLTRIATLQYGMSADALRLPWLDLGPQKLHNLVHERANWTEHTVRSERWFAGEFARFLGKLDAIPEGSGTMLDHTLVAWLQEQSNARTHSREDIPVVLAGGSAYGVRGGRKLALNGPHNPLLLSFCHWMGVDQDRQQFGQYPGEAIDLG